MAQSTPKPRVVWKGAVVFGLVHIPVTLLSAARDNDLDFDWLDKRDLAPIGYQRINKATGKPVDNDDIVKGYAFEKGEYVLMSDADFAAANPEATQQVQIQAFVDASEIGPAHFVAPYFLQAQPRAEKGYVLLRETLAATGRVGVATVVMHRKQRLAIVYPDGKLLRLNTLRFADEMVDARAVDAPDAVKGLARERDMAVRLVEDMTEPFDAARFRDTYRDDLLARIEQKIKTGQTHVLATEADAATPARGAQVIDLMEALKRSLREPARRGARHAAADDDVGGEDAPAERAAAKGRATADAASRRTPKRAVTARSARPRSTASARSRARKRA